MKVAIALAIVGILMCLELSEAGPTATNVDKAFEHEEVLGPAEGRPCKCMNWRSCHGDINSDVPCHPSFIFVCCVVPKPGFNHEDEDQIQVIHV